MVAFRLSSSESSNQPEFFEDYKDLWKKYTEKSGVWKSLCDLLADYAGKNDTIVSFKKKTPKDKNQDVDEFYYVLPFVCSRSAEKIICFLKEQGIVEQGSRVSGHTTGSCKVNSSSASSNVVTLFSSSSIPRSCFLNCTNINGFPTAVTF